MISILKTIHGIFADESSYNIWCIVNNKKPIKHAPIEEQTETIKINDDYDINKRERK